MRATFFLGPDSRASVSLSRLSLWAPLIALSVLWLSSCEEDPGDEQDPDAVLITPIDGATFLNGETVPISFSITENEALQSWSLNIRNENFGASVWSATMNTSETDVFEDTVYLIDVLEDTEFLLELIVVDANQNEDIEKATFFATY